MKLSKLYSRASDGIRISEWEIEYNKHSFRTISGFQGMKQITSEWTECFAKSYNTQVEQTEKQAKALFKKKKESGMFESISDIDDEIHFEPVLAKDFKDYKDKINYKEGVLVQRKFDGIRCIVTSTGMWSRNGKKLLSAPHIFEELKNIFKSNPDLILDGELFAEKEICDFNTIISLVRKTKPTKEDIEESSKYIKYYVYDIPSYKENFANRTSYLAKLNLPSCCIKVDTYFVNNENEIKEYYSQFIEEGYEGIMVKLDKPYQNKRSSYLLKYKEFFDKEFIIKDIIEGVGKLSNKAGTILCEIDGKIFNSAINGTHEYLAEIWKNKSNFIGKTATVKYFELTSDGIPRFPKVINIAREEYE